MDEQDQQQPANQGQSQLQQPAKTWNEELREWCDKKCHDSNTNFTQLAIDIGMPRATFRDYVFGDISDLDRISGERRMQLYNATGLEFFKVEEGYEPKANKVPGPETRKKRKPENKSHRKLEERESYRRVEDSVTRATGNLTGVQKLEAGLLGFQQYRPSPEKRAGAIMELLDVLAEEVDYYRHASTNERQVLVDKLKSDPESFSYVTQILNVVYQGKQMDTWMMMIEAPSKIKRIRRERK